MAYPDFIPDGQRWDSTHNKFVPLSKDNIEDLHKILAQKDGEIEGLLKTIKEKDELQIETVKKLVPPDMSKKLNEYQAEIASLKAQIDSITEEIEGYKREAEQYKQAYNELKKHSESRKKAEK